MLAVLLASDRASTMPAAATVRANGDRGGSTSGSFGGVGCCDRTTCVTANVTAIRAIRGRTNCFHIGWTSGPLAA
jgi:hypothetical protein